MSDQDLSFLYSPLTFQYPERLGPSGWIEHTPFAFWLIEKLRPRCFVELGTHTGISYGAFCQAAKQLALDTRFYAVDTWQGDAHAGHYDSSVYEKLKSYHDRRYSDFSQLMRMTFDAAAKTFEEGTIDLLHIDGLHTYDAVRHDYETWAPKLAEGAVVLFHDTNVHRGDFGVHRYWAEMAKAHRSFEFLHGNGLGVLVPNGEIEGATALGKLFRTADVATVRRTFSFLGRGVSLNYMAAYQKLKQAAS